MKSYKNGRIGKMKIQIGDRIKELRIKRGLTQRELAEIFAVTSQSVSRWENGLSYPDIEQLPMIADYFDITVDELMGRDGRTQDRLERELYELARHGGEQDLPTCARIREVLRKLVKLDPVEYCAYYFRLSLKLLHEAYMIDETDAEEAREVCRKALRDCSEEYRPMLLTNIVLHEEEEKVALWKSFITSDIFHATWDDILLTRYFAQGYLREHWEKQQHKVIYNHVSALIWSLANDKPGESQRVKSMVLGYLHDEAHYRKLLNLIDLFSDEEDGIFFHERICTEIKLAAVLAGKGDCEGAMELIVCLRGKMMRMFENIGKITRGSAPMMNLYEEEFSQTRAVCTAQEVSMTLLRKEFDSLRDDKRLWELDNFAKCVSCPNGRGVMMPVSDEDEEFDITGFLPLLETVRNLADEAKNHCDLEKFPTVIALKAVSGNTYTTVLEDIFSEEKFGIIEKLKEKGDTHIEKMVCMWVESGVVDFCGFAALIAGLDKRNRDTEILLPGYKRYFRRKLEQVYGKNYFR